MFAQTPLTKTFAAEGQVANRRIIRHRKLPEAPNTHQAHSISLSFEVRAIFPQKQQKTAS